MPFSYLTLASDPFDRPPPLATDLFNRPDANQLSLPWVSEPFAQMLQLANSSVVPSLLGGPSSVFSASSYDGGVSWPADQYSEATILNGIPFSGNLAVTVRTDNSGNGYIAWIDFTNAIASHVGPGSSCELVLSIMQGGRWGSGLANPPIFAIGNIVPCLSGDRIRIVAIGNKISLFYNRQLITSFVDNLYSSGKPGLAIFRSNAYNSPTDISMSNFVAGLPYQDPINTNWKSVGLNGFVPGKVLNNFYVGQSGKFTDMLNGLKSVWIPSEPDVLLFNPTLRSVYGNPTPPIIHFPGYAGAAASQLNSSFGPNQFAECTIAAIVPGAPANNHSIGPAVRTRIDPTTGLISCYAMEMRYDGGYQFVWEINVPPGQIFASNTDNIIRGNLAQPRFDLPFGTAPVMRIEAVGNQITGKLNGVVVFGPIADNRISAGQPGIETYPENIPIGFETQVSSFRCGELPSGQIQIPLLSDIGKVTGNPPYSGIQFSNDQFSQATLITLNRGKGYAGLYVRGVQSVDGVVENKYQFLLDGVFNNQGIGVPTSAKIANGTGFIAQTIIIPKSGDVFLLQAIGNLVSVFQNGNLILEVIDSTVSSGNPGIFASPSNGLDTDIAWDNWSGGVVVSGKAIVQQTEIQKAIVRTMSFNTPSNFK